MKILKTLLIIALLATPLIAEDEYFTISVSTDRLSYRHGEPVEIIATLSNATSTSNTSARCWGCEYEIWLENMYGEIVADQNTIPLWWVTEHTVEARSSQIITLGRWWQDPTDFPIGRENPDDLIAPGVYRVALKWQRKGVFYSEPFEIRDNASSSPRSFFIPAAGNNPGLGGTQWTTDLHFQGLGGGDSDVVLSLFAHGIDNSTPTTFDFRIRSLESQIAPNVLDRLFGYEGQAALHVEIRGSDLHITSRTYNNDSEGTYGQAIPVIPVTQARTSHLLPNLVHIDSEWRTNIGVINLTPEALTVTIRLVAPHAPIHGPWQTHDLEITLEPHGYRQLNNVFEGHFESPIHNGFAWVGADPLGESPHGLVLAYGSVIDNRTGDAIFVSPIPAMVNPDEYLQDAP